MTFKTMHPLKGKSIEEFLECLPLIVSIVSDGGRLKGGTDDELQAWGWGIEDTTEHLKFLISEWKAINCRDAGEAEYRSWFPRAKK